MSPIRFEKADESCPANAQGSPLIPPRIGGMATPLGVYMTSGPISGGSGLKGLLVTGAMFAAIMIFIEQALMVFYSVLEVVFPWWAVWAIIHPMVIVTTQISFSLLVFLALIRFTPMAGLHGAEHKTINALEYGQLPETETILQYPRQHARCGTNLGVILFLLQWVVYSLWLMRFNMSPLGMVLYFILGAGIIWKFWKPAGYLIQTHFTTKEPTPEQLQSGQQAAEELLAKYAVHPHGKPELLQKIWGMGLIQLIISFGLTYVTLQWLLEQTPWLL